MEWLEANTGLVIGIILSLANIGAWIWKYFNKAYKLKKNNDDFHEKVERHDKELKSSNEKFDVVIEKFDALTEVIKIQLRYNIVSACNDALEKSKIDQYQLQAIEDMYTVYSEILHANSYVTTLVKKVRKLEISNLD